MTQTAFITGANRGIGKAIARRLGSMGYNLALLARDTAALAEVGSLCRALDCRVLELPGELTDTAFTEQAVQAALNEFGTLNVLINNAGTARHQAVQDADLQAWHGVMSVNFTAALELSRYVLPGMIERRSGTVIHISSISGRNTSAGSAIYSASKHALNGLAGCMFEDVRDYGIKVSTIMPGFVATDLTANTGLDQTNMITAEDVADSVQYILSASANCCPTEIVLRPQQRP